MKGLLTITYAAVLLTLSGCGDEDKAFTRALQIPSTAELLRPGTSPEITKQYLSDLNSEKNKMEQSYARHLKVGDKNSAVVYVKRASDFMKTAIKLADHLIANKIGKGVVEVRNKALIIKRNNEKWLRHANSRAEAREGHITPINTMVNQLNDDISILLK